MRNASLLVTKSNLGSKVGLLKEQVRQERIVILDFYLFIAAYGVVLYHISEFAGPNADRRFALTMHEFGLFVDFFFVLSGFVICRNYFGAVGSVSAIVRFLQKRIARIYPLYIATLLWYLSIFAFGLSSHSAGYDAPSIIAQFFMVQQWRLNPSWPANFPAWSVSAEWAMYLAFPALAALAKRTGALSLLILAALIYVSIWTLVEIDALHHPIISALRAAPAFCIGMAIARFNTAIENGAVMGTILFATTIVLMIFHTPMVVLIITFASTIFLTASDVSRPNFLQHRWLGTLGDLSYAVYLTHAIFFSVFYRLILPRFPTTDPILLGLGVSILVLLSAFPVYRLFENPARRWVSKWRLDVSSPLMLKG